MTGGCVGGSTSETCTEKPLLPRAIALASLLFTLTITVLLCALGRRYVKFRVRTSRNASNGTDEEDDDEEQQQRSCSIDWELVRQDRENFCVCGKKDDDDQGGEQAQAPSLDRIAELRQQRIRQRQMEIAQIRAEENRHAEYLRSTSGSEAVLRRVQQNQAMRINDEMQRTKKRRAFLERELNFTTYHEESATKRLELKDPGQMSALSTTEADSQGGSGFEYSDDTPAFGLGDCAICLDRLRGGDLVNDVSSSSCSHVFHKECLLDWLAKHDVCPCCRVPLVKEEVSRQVI